MKLDVDPAAVKALHQVGGSALVEQMVRLFLEHTPRRVEAALAAEKAGDWVALERAAHSMKSSAGHLGIRGLQERAAQIEDLAERRQATDLRLLLEDVASSFPALRELLQKHLPS